MNDTPLDASSETKRSRHTCECSRKEFAFSLSCHRHTCSPEVRFPYSPSTEAACCLDFGSSIICPDLEIGIQRGKVGEPCKRNSWNIA